MNAVILPAWRARDRTAHACERALTFGARSEIAQADAGMAQADAGTVLRLAPHPRERSME
jgi:hypothetical protein